jgi:neutral ceramidase
MAVRVGDGVIVTLPGEPTAEVGARVRTAVSAAAGVGRIVVSGLANEFIQYLTTPEEYDRQHYEGGSTLYGPLSSNLLRGELVELSRRLMSGEPAQAAYPFDPTNGVSPDGPPFGPGVASASITAMPGDLYRRFERVRFSWRGGAFGIDRPLDRAFVTIERLARRGWRPVDSDLGLGTLWKVDDQGRYQALWEIPLHLRKGRHRMVVTANRYRLVSRPFRVAPSRGLTLRRVEGGVTLDYPPAVRDQDLRHRPASASGGTVRYRDGSRTVTLRRRRGSVFPVPAGAAVLSARDRFGNRALTSSGP